MATPNQLANSQPEDTGAGRRSIRSRKPSEKITELKARKIEEQLAREAEAEAAAIRAGKRRRHYSPAELEEAVQKRLRASAGDSDNQITIHPLLPPPSQYQRAGVNIDYVNRVREAHGNQRTESPHPGDLPSVDEQVVDVARTSSRFALASNQHTVRAGTPMQAGSASHYTLTPTGFAPFVRSPTPLRPPPNACAGLQNRLAHMQPLGTSHLVHDVGPDDHFDDQEPRLSIIQGLDSHRLISIPSDSATQSEASDDDLEPATIRRFDGPLPFRSISPTPRNPSAPQECLVVGSTGMSIAPPPSRSKPILPANDNPESKTYGDGEGELLQPRRIVPRQPVDTTGMTAKGKRKARNQMRPKQAEYHPLEMEILHTATMRMAAVCCCTDPSSGKVGI
ncbi:hypothetical protein FRC12_014339 [Ceratobasidium sp. 428]|nr:hypothetical protein FRC12_014339 [Ceratobasidium sp. 428]